MGSARAIPALLALMSTDLRVASRLGNGRVRPRRDALFGGAGLVRSFPRIPGIEAADLAVECPGNLHRTV